MQTEMHAGHVPVQAGRTAGDRRVDIIGSRRGSPGDKGQCGYRWGKKEGHR